MTGRQKEQRAASKAERRFTSAPVRARVAGLLCLAAVVSCAHHTQQVKAAPPQPPPSAIERQVRNALDAGEGDYRLRRLQEQVAATPDDLAARMELAHLYLERGSPELAVEHYRLAAARYPASAELEVALAHTLRGMGLREEAARSIEAFWKAHPQTSPELQSLLGIDLDEMGRWSDGEKAHRAALALNPNLEYLHNNLGYNLLMQSRPQEAAQEFRRALELDPHSALARNNLGLALASQPEQAVANWQAVSDPATAHSNLAAMYIEQGRYAEARKELEVALGYDKSNPAALHNLRLVAELDGQPAKMPVKPAQTPLRKVATALRKAFIGPEEVPPRGAEPSASADTRRGL
ncbi:MAG TPA: tetratricopeptide repeat protein [Bryobacteraceae bacterium]|nr:tetratricopeptide repeat protein [Bryobacteraceae bacterium]